MTPAIQGDLGLSDTEAGLLQGLAFALFYTLFGVPLGWIADRWNRKWLLAIGMSCWSVMTAFCGVANGFAPLFLARLGVGMGEGSLNPSVSSLIPDYFEPRTRSRAFSVYAMGSAVGNGLTYFCGGLLLNWLGGRGGLEVIGIGQLKPWRAMFVLVGLAGLIPAILFMTTVREPKRRELAVAGPEWTSGARIRAFIRENWVTMACHHFGIALTVTGIYGFVTWLPTFFLRVHGWSPAQFSVIYGACSLGMGVAGALAAGWLTAWLRQRGTSDAAWRLCLAGAIGTVMFAALAAIMPTPGSALVCVLVGGAFANFPSVLGIASISQFVPNEMRGVITAIYYMTLGILTAGVGPGAVGWVTDHIYHDKAAIAKSLLVVGLSTGIPAILLLAFGLRAFRASVSRAHWLVAA